MEARSTTSKQSLGHNYNLGMNIGIIVRLIIFICFLILGGFFY